MKRIMMFALAAVTALSIGTTGTLAAGAGMGRNFSDTDGDGVCDRFANRPYRQGRRGSGFHGRHNNR